MFKLKKIGVVSLGYVFALAAFIATLFQAIMLAVQINNPILAQQLDPTIVSTLGGNVLLIVLLAPFIGLIVGFVVGVISAALYNWVIVPLTGGLKLELSK